MATNVPWNININTVYILFTKYKISYEILHLNSKQ